jgi:hypothetical protein
MPPEVGTSSILLFQLATISPPDSRAVGSSRRADKTLRSAFSPADLGRA